MVLAASTFEVLQKIVPTYVDWVACRLSATM